MKEITEKHTKALAEKLGKFTATLDKDERALLKSLLLEGSDGTLELTAETRKGIRAALGRDVMCW